MKVLQINSVCGIRSTGKICTDIARVLEQKGHECKIAYGRENVPGEYRDISVRIGSETDVKLHALGTRIFDNTGFWSTRETKRFVEWAKIYDPDIIHLHNLHGYYINIRILFDYLQVCGKPVVWTFHDCWPFTGHCAYFDYANCDKWLNGCERCPQKKEYPTSMIFDRSALNYNEKKRFFASIENLTVVTPSEWLAKLVKESFFKDNNVKVINNGIDLDVFKPTSKSDFRKSYNLLDKEVVLGVASTWGERKGLDVFSILSERLPDDYAIVLVGTNEDIDRSLPDRIISIHRTNNQRELAEIYSAADVFVNPTREDNYPTVNMEALACGTPVLTYRTGGSPEMLDPSCGSIVDRDDIKAFANEIMRICEHKPYLPESCVKRAQSFDMCEKYEDYVCLYESLLSK